MLVVGCALAVSSGTARLGSLRAALAIDRTMLKLAPRRAHMIWLHMALLYERKGQSPRALESLAKGRAEGVEPFVFDLEIARILEKTGDSYAAASVYDRILTYPELSDRFRKSVSEHIANLHAAKG